VSTLQPSETHEKDPPPPLLGSSGDSATPPPSLKLRRPKRTPQQAEEDRKSKRLSRHAVKAIQRKATKAKASRFCWYPISAEVSIDVGRALTAHVQGIQRCGSACSCPVCAPVVRQRRAEQIDIGLNRHLAAGGGAEFASFTATHALEDELEPRYAAMVNGLHSLLQGAAWDRYKTRLGYLGSIRVTEVTWGLANGWHPHNHVAMVFERPLTDDERQALWRWLHNRWRTILLAKGFGTITEAFGVDVRQVTGNVLGEYLTKVEGGWTTGLELARGDLKSGKKADRLTPFGILTEFAGTGDLAMKALWLEYEEATFGKRWLRWSPGLKRRLGITDDKTDEELAASEGRDVALIRWFRAAKPHTADLWRGTTGLYLNEVEEAAGWVILLSDLLGQELRPIEKGPGP